METMTRTGFGKDICHWIQRVGFPTCWTERRLVFLIDRKMVIKSQQRQGHRLWGMF